MAFLSTAWLSGYVATTLVRRAFSRFYRHLTTTELEHRPLSDIHYQPSRITRMSTNAVKTKPPNILVYAGSGEEGGRDFEFIKDVLSRILDRNSYVVYQIDDDKVLHHPWSKNSVLLLIHNTQTIQKPILRKFEEYLVNGGSILSVGCKDHENLSGLLGGVTLKPLDLKCSDDCTVEIITDRLDIPLNQVDIPSEPFFFEGMSDTFEVLANKKGSGRPMIVYSCNQQSKAILSIVDLFTSNHVENKRQLLQALLKKLDVKCVSQQIPCLTPAFLFASKKNIDQLLKSLRPHLSDGICKGKQVSLLFCDKSTTQNIPLTREDMLPVNTDHAAQCGFDWEIYQEHLNTNTLGQMVIYTDVIPSTQTLLEGNLTFVQNIPEQIGIVAVTRQQVKGKGRSGNAWLSPIGCLMFSTVVTVEFGTELGSRLPYLQHIASLALVEALRSVEGYQKINVCLKWPNDIYYGRNVKIGGVVVSSTAYGNSFSAVIGMGVNVSNKEPTICINDVIKQYNEENNTHLAELSLEMLLARTVTCMENLIVDFQKHGKEGFLRKYYKWWLHSDSKVTLNTAGHPQEVTIIGLDDFGFLLVQKESGEKLSVQPDGNTFDLLANLIAFK
ncbi:biotin--protein ligase-like [Actinia tenebrosa]|uniref:Biotin--protein ligase-like n=1 Tax=Actinia tenebrosa TaxID=6105 RepID=A0A6P8HF47_ACTTE|nr:biotin--protein ligase-like [Actinia tenebrosa]